VIVLAALVAGVLASSGVWLILQRNLVRVTLGFCMLANAGNLFLIATTGDPGRGKDPIVVVNRAGELAEPMSAYVDPLPQALILTAIVISFAVTAFQIALVYKLHRDSGRVVADAFPAEDAA